MGGTSDDTPYHSATRQWQSPATATPIIWAAIKIPSSLHTPETMPDHVLAQIQLPTIA